MLRMLSLLRYTTTAPCPSSLPQAPVGRALARRMRKAELGAGQRPSCLHRRSADAIGSLRGDGAGRLGHGHRSAMNGKRRVALFGHNIGAGRDQAAQMRHSPDFGPMVEATLDSWAHYPMVVALVAKCRTGHCTQWSFGDQRNDHWV